MCGLNLCLIGIVSPRDLLSKDSTMISGCLFFLFLSLDYNYF